MLQRIFTGMVLAFVAVAVGAAERIDINVAGADQLAAMLDGVGQARAEAIVEYREENGGFNSVDDLVNVSGIGTVTLEANRDLLTVEGR